MFQWLHLDKNPDVEWFDGAAQRVDETECSVVARAEPDHRIPVRYPVAQIVTAVVFNTIPRAVTTRIQRLRALPGRVPRHPIRRAGREPLCRDQPPRALSDLALLDDSQRDELLTIARVAAFQLGAGAAMPAYRLRNLAGNIARYRKRLNALSA